MKRRTAIKVVALSTLSSIPAAGQGFRVLGVAWDAGEYRLRFFTGQENELLDKLMEMIIPADAHSPGAQEARVSLFADLMVATSGDHVKEQWRKGLRLMREEAARSSLAGALAKAAAGEKRKPSSDLERFFTALKGMTVDGYYTSAIGIHQDLQYQGNTYLASFPGCQFPKLAD